MLSRLYSTTICRMIGKPCSTTRKVLHGRAVDWQVVAVYSRWVNYKAKDGCAHSQLLPVSVSSINTRKHLLIDREYMYQQYQ